MNAARVIGLMLLVTIAVATVAVMTLTNWDALPLLVEIAAVILVISTTAGVGISVGRTIEYFRQQGVIPPSIWEREAS